MADRNAPVRMEFGDGSVALTAGGDASDAGGRAEEQLEVAYDGEPITTAFNPQFLLDGLGALGTGTARMLFTSATKPVVLRPTLGGGSDVGGGDTGSDTGEKADPGTPDRTDYTYLIMPVRLPG